MITDSELGATLDARVSPVHDAVAEEMCHDCNNLPLPRAPVPCRYCAVLAMQHSTLADLLACMWCLKMSECHYATGCLSSEWFFYMIKRSLRV